MSFASALGVDDKAVNRVMQQSQMAAATSNHNLPSCFTASTVAAPTEHVRLLPPILASPRALTLICQFRDGSFDQQGGALVCTFRGVLRVVVVPAGRSSKIYEQNPYEAPRASAGLVSQISIHTCLQMFPPKLTGSDLICVGEEEEWLVPRED